MAVKKQFAEIASTSESLRTVGEREFEQTLTVRTFTALAVHGKTPRYFALLRDLAGDGTPLWAELCKRCAGTGNFGYGPFGGVCFSCNHRGLGDGPRLSESAMNTLVRTWGLRVQRESVKTSERIAARAAETTAWREQNADLVDWAASLTPVTSQYDAYNDRTWETFAGGTSVTNHVVTLRGGGKLDTRDESYIRTVMRRALDREANGPQGRHAGRVGERVTVIGTVRKAEVVDGDYGNSVRIVLAGTGEHEGIVLTTYSTGAGAWDVREGTEIGITATVKALGEFGGALETKVTRSKFLTAGEAEEALAQGTRKPRTPKAPKSPRVEPLPAPVVESAAPAPVETTPAATVAESPNPLDDYAGGTAEMAARFAEKSHGRLSAEDLTALAHNAYAVVSMDGGERERLTLAQWWDLLGDVHATGTAQMACDWTTGECTVTWEGGEIRGRALTMSEAQSTTPSTP